jgi:hypothetical protein
MDGIPLPQEAFFKGTAPHVRFYTFVHRKKARHRRKQFHLVPSGSLCRFVGSVDWRKQRRLWRKLQPS